MNVFTKLVSTCISTISKASHNATREKMS